MRGVKRVYLSIQKNCVLINSNNKLLSTFDMKGSLFGRQVMNLQDILKNDSFRTDLTTISTEKNSADNKEIDLPEAVSIFLKRNSEPLKDLDFLSLRKQYGKVFRIKLPILDRKHIVDLIEKDAHFLSGCNIMDYSILIGIEHVHKSRRDTNAAPRQPV